MMATSALVDETISHKKDPLIKEIPVRNYIKQFMISEFGAEPICIHQNTFMGRVVLLVTEKSPYRINKPKDEKPAGETLKIKLPTALKHQTISAESLRNMGNFFEKLFQQQLIMFVKGQVKVTQNELAAITSFYNAYDINPDDYDLEVARKVWRDYKEKLFRETDQKAKKASK